MQRSAQARLSDSMGASLRHRTSVYLSDNLNKKAPSRSRGPGQGLQLAAVMVSGVAFIHLYIFKFIFIQSLHILLRALSHYKPRSHTHTRVAMVSEHI